MQQPRLNGKYNIVLLKDPGSAVSDAYRTLRINIEFASVSRETKTIAVTSANRGEGKTTAALNLAVAYAQVGKKTLLVDANLRHPGIHSVLNLNNTIGLTNVLGQLAQASEAVKETDIPNLFVMTSGPVPFNPSELLASKQFDNLLEECKRQYDVILMDTSPALSLLDAKIVAAKSDGVLLIVEYRKLKRDAAAKLKEEMNRIKANLLGVAFMKVNAKYH